MSRIIDLTGKQFGRLIVLGLAKSDGNGKHAYWECKCECGITKLIRSNNLLSGKSKSCGCWNKDQKSQWKGEKSPAYRHGGAYTRLYRIWSDMNQRCYNSNNSAYHYYGGRGVYVCEQWNHRNPNGFENFQKWALANGYKSRLELDKDKIKLGNLCYCPEYCCFLTRQEQLSYTRHNHYIEVEGIKMTISDAARKYGIMRETIYDRLKKGWSIEDIFDLSPNEEPIKWFIYPDGCVSFI